VSADSDMPYFGLHVGQMQAGPMDYITRPLRPTYFDPPAGSRQQAGSTAEGLSFSSRFDNEDPRYSRKLRWSESD